MRMPTEEELVQQTRGRVVAIHGKSGVGKTTTALATSPEPILFVSTEQRPMITNLENTTKIKPITTGDNWREEWSKEVVRDWYNRGNKVVYPDDNDNTVEDFRGFWQECYNRCKDGTFKYKTIIYDTPSYWLNIIVMNQLQKEFYRDVVDKAKKAKEVLQTSLTDQYAIGLRQYGALANIANSMMSVIKPMSQFNVFVCLVFQSESNPNFNQAYEQAPYVKGKEFMKDFMGHCDIIGVVLERIENGVQTFPPYISFDAQPRYLTKWCGKKQLDEHGNPVKLEIMDFRKIFGY
jgi:hypothetical protein